MRSSWSTWALAGVAVVSSLSGMVVVPGAAALQESPSGQEGPPARQATDADAVRGDLGSLQAQIERLEARLRELSRQRAGVVEEFEAADVELALRRQQLRLLQERGRLLREDISEQAAEIDRLTTELTTARAALRERVVDMYRMGPLTYGRLLFELDDAENVVAAYQFVTFLSARDDALIRGVRDRLGALESARTEVGETEDELGTVLDDTDTATRELEARQEERRVLLGQLDRETESGRLALERARRSALDLEALLDRLTRTPSVEEVASFEAARGALPWPGAGEVSGSFGRRRHPVYDTFTVSKGIEVSAVEGSLVTAIFRGRVVFADWFTGYGLVVILEHGQEYFTLYGHLASVAVEVGDTVASGNTVGTVGDTGSLTGVNLYFEIRQGTEALNPAQWLVPRE